jgi:hypothetical protein
MGAVRVAMPGCTVPMVRSGMGSKLAMASVLLLPFAPCLPTRVLGTTMGANRLRRRPIPHTYAWRRYRSWWHWGHGGWRGVMAPACAGSGSTHGRHLLFEEHVIVAIVISACGGLRRCTSTSTCPGTMCRSLRVDM